MKDESNGSETHDYVGIAAFLVFLAVLWQNTYFTNTC